MAQILSIGSEADQLITTTVGSQKIELRLRYLDQDCVSVPTGWYADLKLFTATEVQIVQGQKLTTYNYIGRNLNSPMVGRIYVTPLVPGDPDLTSRSPWGVTHDLVYFPPSEIPSGVI